MGSTRGQYQIVLALALLLVPVPAVWAYSALDQAPPHAEPQVEPQAQPPAQPPAEPQAEPQAGPQAEPQSRAEVLRRQRQAKLLELTPQTPDSIERRMLVLEDPESRDLMDANVWGFYPRTQFVSRGSGIGLGTRFWRPNVGGRPLDIAGSAFYTLKKYQYYDFQIGRIPHADYSLPLRSWKGDDVYELADTRLPGSAKLTLYGTLRFRHLPQEDYFGLGPDSSLENHTTYRQDDATAELVAGYALAPWFQVAARGGYQTYDIGPGEDSNLPSIDDVFNPVTAPGLLAQPDFTRLTGQLIIDRRDEPGNPHRGVVIAIAASRYDDIDGDDFRFNRFALDARAFVPLGNPQRIIALRLRGFFDDPLTGRVPFYLQESLGGSHTLRGFDSFRFRGEKVILGQVEYRWLAALPFEFAVFYDIGTVSAPGKDLDFDDLKSNWGVGLRIKNFRTTLVRLDYARSFETSVFMFRVSSSF